MTTTVSLYNATPHDIHVITSEGGERVTFVKSGPELRLDPGEQALVDVIPAQNDDDSKEILIPVAEPPVFKGIIGSLPEDTATRFTGVLVSSLVGEYLQTHSVPEAWRTLAFYSPDMGPKYAVRDAKGNPSATRRLLQWATSGKKRAASEIE
jgi:hypothetical protein